LSNKTGEVAWLDRTEMVQSDGHVGLL